MMHLYVSVSCSLKGQLLREGATVYLFFVCFLELILQGISVLRSVRMNFKLSYMIKTFIYWTNFLTYLNILYSSPAEWENLMGME